MAFGSAVLTHKKEQQIKIAGEFKPTVDCLCATRRGFVAVYIEKVRSAEYSLKLSAPLIGYAFAAQILSVSDRMMISKMVGNDGQYTKELWIDRRENSKSLAWSSVLLALNNIKEVGAVVDRPKALGDIRGVTYIYGMFYRFGLIEMPDKVNGKMKRAGRQM